jgi:hypothetical protein
MPAHLPFGGTLDAVRVQDQEASAEMAAGPAQFAQGDLQALRVGHGAGGEQIVNGLITGDEGQTVGHFEAFLAEGAATAQIAVAQGGLVDDLERQSRSQLLGLGPTAEQLPGSQAQMFGQQQPDANLIAGDAVGQQLTDAPLQGPRVGRFTALAFGGALGENGRAGRLGVKGVEFFFAGRSR